MKLSHFLIKNIVAVTLFDLPDAEVGSVVSSWVGIDGIEPAMNNKQIVVQAGFDATKFEDQISYTFFYEWYPHDATFINFGPCKVGDGESSGTLDRH